MSIDQPTASQNLIVVAIDVGTTYSGYAFSFRNKPSEVTVVNWENHASNGFSYKAPSVLLLNQTYQFVAFGYEAEKQYSDIITREPTDQYLFVKNFKTELVNDRVILCYQQILYDIVDVFLLFLLKETIFTGQGFLIITTLTEYTPSIKRFTTQVIVLKNAPPPPLLTKFFFLNTIYLLSPWLVIAFFFKFLGKGD